MTLKNHKRAWYAANGTREEKVRNDAVRDGAARLGGLILLVSPLGCRGGGSEPIEILDLAGSESLDDVCHVELCHADGLSESGAQARHDAASADVCPPPDPWVFGMCDNVVDPWPAEPLACAPNCPSPGGLEWVQIPGGTFAMGCSPGDTCFEDEYPPHVVTVSRFAILDTEVTQEQYGAVMITSPSCPQSLPFGPGMPVHLVTWFDAQVFCGAIGARLPTEAEWEYAARGGTTTKYYCGDDNECLDESAWFHCNSDGRWHTVRQKAPNGFGLYDMLGNVSEWTADWYDDSYYQHSPSLDPSGPPGRYGRYRDRSIRGGDFWDNSPGISVSTRFYMQPDVGLVYVGFRCVRDVTR